ncbi:MAG: sodium:calcium antiporter [Opitutales bacterium]
MAWISSWPFWSLIGTFIGCAVLIAVFGYRLTAVADQLADRGGLGEALVGGILLGALTSISGSVLSVTAAWHGSADLAISNALGGIAIQTVFLVVADIFYRKANLEHAAASAENMMQGVLLVCLLSIFLMSTYSPEWTVWGIHSGTVVMLIGYGYGMHLVNRARKRPMWYPRQTGETREDAPDRANIRLSLKKLWTGFLVLGGVLALCGWFLNYVASAIVDQSGLEFAIMGALFTAVATSLPELVTTVSAVKRGALTLAVSGIIGGNAYDSLFAAFADIAYREGSIYHGLDASLIFWVPVNILMVAILLLGMLLRERKGVGGIGFESALVIGLYVVAVATLVLR